MAFRFSDEIQCARFGQRVQLLFAETGNSTDQIADARKRRVRPLLDDDAYAKKRPALLYYLARAEYEDGQPRAGFGHIERYLEMMP